MAYPRCEFVKAYLRRSKLEGLPGLAWSVLQAVSPMVKHLKAHERERDR